MEVTKVPKKIVTVIEPKRSMTVDKEKYRQKRVAAYCRVSTDSEEQLVSYTNQKKVYTEMIASRKDWCFAGLFADEGKSGTRADKRPEFNKMINDCLAGKIDYIITKSVSRFARNTVDCLDYARMLKSKGIGVYFEEQQIDTLKTDSELYLVIYAGFAQSESESISKNITWSVRKKFEEGTPVFMYKRFLGYKKGADGEPEIVPSEAAIVERIFNLYLAGETVDKISKMMQAENYDIPGKTISFSKGMIMNMLSNERYCGDAILQKSVTIDCIEKKRKKNTGEAPIALLIGRYHSSFPRICSTRKQSLWRVINGSIPTHGDGPIICAVIRSNPNISGLLVAENTSVQSRPCFRNCSMRGLRTSGITLVHCFGGSRAFSPETHSASGIDWRNRKNTLRQWKKSSRIGRHSLKPRIPTIQSFAMTSLVMADT